MRGETDCHLVVALVLVARVLVLAVVRVLFALVLVLVALVLVLAVVPVLVAQLCHTA
jgi:hypothetical protein